MHNLRDLQIRFQQSILQNDSSFQSEIIETENLSADTRLTIYRDAYYLRLIEVLEFDFPGVKDLLKEKFESVCRDYIDTFPSTFRSVRYFGKFFAEFLKSQDKAVAEKAEFEWLMTDAFDAKEMPVMTIDEMAAIPPDQWSKMSFTLHPSVYRMQMTQKEWLIWRKDLAVLYCALSADEAFMIDAMRDGKNFSSICEGLCEWIEEDKVGMHAAMLLKRFLLDNLITSVAVNSSLLPD